MYLTRTAGIETIVNTSHFFLLFLMYLTRTAGIETVGCQGYFPQQYMYLTRTAGIETLSFLLLPVTHKGILPALRELKLWQNAERKGTNVGKCILPALRELKRQSRYTSARPPNVSYPHCGNFRFLFTNKKHVIRWYASARMACFLFFLFYFVGI